MVSNKSNQGYLLSTGILNIYSEDNKSTMSKELIAIRKDLKNITRSIKIEGVDIREEIRIAWKHFSSSSEITSISELSFALQLVIKNPIVRDRFLTERCRKLSREHMFSKDTDVKNSKILVNEFYRTNIKENNK